MATKIPTDVSAIRKRFAQAAAKRGLAGPVVLSKQTPEPANRKAGQEAAEARKKVRLAEQNAAEKDLELEKLRTDLAAAQAKVLDLEPRATSFDKLDHRRKWEKINMFPKEEHNKISKLPFEAIEMLVQARFPNGGAPSGGGSGAKSTGLKWKNMEELSALAKTDLPAYKDGIAKLANKEVAVNASGVLVL